MGEDGVLVNAYTVYRVPDSQLTKKILIKKISANQALGLAESFMRCRQQGKHPDLEIIDQLGLLALSSDPAAAALGVKALYLVIIEGLCDDFSTSGVELGNLVLLRLLTLVRSVPAGRRTDDLLNSLGYADSRQLLDRYRRIAGHPASIKARREKIKKIIILSRVTVGADVAITSIMAQRLQRFFINSEIVIIGPRHINEIFYDLDSVSYIPFNYVRQGNLLDRMTFWPDLYEMVELQCRGQDSAACLVFDPDSRLSQLGLLPLLAEQDTCYFNSRQDQSADGLNLSLSELTNQWLNKILDENNNVPPLVANCSAHEKAATVFFRQFKHSFIATANFGVGEDSRKRVIDPFEEHLVFALLEKPDTILILDTGSTGEEKIRIEKIIKSARNRGINIDIVQENELDCKKINFSHGIINFNGGVSSLAAVIRRSNIFLGYDSCCQHLATAIGLPTVITFAGAPNKRFRYRWQPENRRGLTITIPVESQPYPAEIPMLVKKIIAAIQAVIKKNR